MWRVVVTGPVSCDGGRAYTATGGLLPRHLWEQSPRDRERNPLGRVPEAPTKGRDIRQLSETARQVEQLHPERITNIPGRSGRTSWGPRGRLFAGTNSRQAFGRIPRDSRNNPAAHWTTKTNKRLT